MKVYLVQHGKALEKEKNPDRPLAPDGVAETDRIARFLGVGLCRIDVIWHSSKLRAAQTAQRLAPFVAPNGVIEERDGLKPKDDPKVIAKALKGLSGDVMLVGHLPLLAKLAALLLTGNPEADVIDFTCSGVLCLEQGESGVWRVAWYIGPALIKV